MSSSALLGLSALLIAAVFFIFVAIIAKGARERSLVSRRFSNDKKGSGMQAWGADVVGRFTSPEAIRAKIEKDSELTAMLWQAGIRTAQYRSFYYFASTLTPVVLVVLALGYQLISREGFNHPLMMVLIAAILGVLLPKRIVGMIAESRKRKITDELPIFVQLLKILFDAGLAVEQGLRVIVAEARTALPETCKEIDFVLKRSSSGLDLSEELDHGAKLLNVDEFSDVVNILKQMVRQGGGAKASLTKLSQLVEDRRMTAMQEKVNKMSAKMAMVMVVFMFPALLILIAAPGFMAVTKAFMK